MTTAVEKNKTAVDLQTNFKELANEHLKLRASDNPEFQREFIKTLSDLMFSQNDEMFKKEKKNGSDIKTATGEYDALVIFDINFQKQQILNLKNCKRFFTAEIHDGVKIISDLATGNF